MSRRAPPNAAAERAAQNQQTIKTLLKLEGNKSCADCKRNKRKWKDTCEQISAYYTTCLKLTGSFLTDPRWASWNLGVFVCIRYDMIRGFPQTPSICTDPFADVLGYIGEWALISAELNLWTWMPGRTSSYKAYYAGEIQGRTSQSHMARKSFVAV